MQYSVLKINMRLGETVCVMSPLTPLNFNIWYEQESYMNQNVLI